MDAKDIKAFLDADPFESFTISTTRTGSYSISDPSQVLLTRNVVYIGTDVAADGIADEHVEIPTMQIARIDV